jgi:hypothetical protein
MILSAGLFGFGDEDAREGSGSGDGHGGWFGDVG